MAAGTPVRVPPAESPTRSAAETLDWTAFRARFYPGHRERHDFEALVAYGGYRRNGSFPGSA
jgi:hypothetical protein